MCTVTFVPSRGTVILTSSRDEKNTRKEALAPEVYATEKGSLLYPRDGDAGGTWIAGHENGNAVVLLNGANIAHISSPPYRRSRGVMLLELIKDPMPYSYFRHTTFSGIEPFTLILIETHRLWHCWWDGDESASRELPFDQPHIWSSATLYDSTMMRLRQQWFREWLDAHPHPGTEEVMDFHFTGGIGDPNIDLQMDREGVVSTVSISCLHLREKEMEMHYHDIRMKSNTRSVIPIRKKPHFTP